MIVVSIANEYSKGVSLGAVYPFNGAPAFTAELIVASAVKTKSNDALLFSSKSIKSFKYKSSSIFQLIVDLFLNP